MLQSMTGVKDELKEKDSKNKNKSGVKINKKEKDEG